MNVRELQASCCGVEGFNSKMKAGNTYHALLLRC